MTAAAPTLPAQRLDASGRPRVSVRAIVALALPLIANSAVQLVLSLTDVWFIGRLSTNALAAVAAVHWMALVVVLTLSGVGMAVQTVVSQRFGSGRYRRGSQAVWMALWAVLLAVPLFLLAGLAGRALLAPFGLDPQIQQLAASFWLPRVAASPFGAAVWALLGFFNGIGRPRITLLISALMTAANVLLNQVFIFELHWGIAGSGLATGCAQALGFALGLAIFLGPQSRRRFHSHLTWRLNRTVLVAQLRLGVPMGLLSAADLFGFSLFQLMQVRLGTVGGATTQLVMMLTAIAYMPGFGIALAGTTLVGQAIGAGNRAWAFAVGNRVIALCALYMGGTGLLLALLGPELLPLFVQGTDPRSLAVVQLGARILWLAAIYQFFDGLNLGAGLCLRGAGDSVIPAALVIALSWFVFVPLAHMLIFAPGAGWVGGLPQAGLGVLGGWVAVVLYVVALGTTLLVRWRSRAWERVQV